LSDFTDQGSTARTLLQQYPSGVRSSGANLTVSRTLQPPVIVDRYVPVERLDHLVSGGSHRQMVRISYAGIRRPDFIWSPFREFVSGLSENTANLALTSADVFTPTLTAESRIGLSFDGLGWNRAHPETPTLSSGDGTSLPGSPAFYAF